MSSDGAVSFDRVTKTFGTRRSGRSAAWPWSSVTSPGGKVAVHDVTFEVPKGQRLGIIGPNGAGKSTLLKLLAGVISPTHGTVSHRGRIGAMIELGLGFHPLLPGRDNAVIAAMMLGLDQQEARRRVGEMLEFADLEDVAHLPLREYSTGMVARLGFATATHCDADLLVVDEVLSVGDMEFQDRCLDHIARQVDGGATLLLVSHDMALVRAATERVLLLHEGALVEDGPSGDIVESYLGLRSSPLSEAGGVTLRSLRAEPRKLEPLEELHFDATMTLDEPTATHLEVALLLYTVGVELVLNRTIIPLDERMRRPGVHRIAGRTSPIPLEGGSIKLQVSVLSASHRPLARDVVEVQMLGTRRSLKPTYPVRVDFELTPMSTPASAARRAATGRTVAAPAVTVEGVTKTFRGERGGPRRSRRRGRATVLDDVSLVIGRGETIGLIGPNGAGKSTLLRCIAGLTRLDGGTITTTNPVVPILELEIGFQPDFDGWDNLATTARLMGLSAAEVAAITDQVVAFAGLAADMDRPVRHWSSGMRARLGFALASHVPAAVLLIDETLAVGDHEFRRQAVDKVRELSAAGVTIIHVSHDLRLIGETSDRVVHLEAGRVVDDGPPLDVIERYGGTGWSSGVYGGHGGVRLHAVTWEPAPTGSDEMGVLGALVEVALPSPHVRLDLSLRDPRGIDDTGPMDATKAESFSISMVTAAEEGSLATPGWYTLTAHVAPDRLGGRGSFHAVLSAVDVIDGDYVAEAWTPIRWGNREAEGTLGVGWDFGATIWSHEPDAPQR